MSVDKKKSKLSVIIPVLNDNNTLLKTLNTVTSQSYNDLEIIISDKSETDKLSKSIKDINDKRIKYHHSSNIKNFSDDWETALNYASGEYIMFLGQDDGLIFGAIELGMNLIEKYNVKALTWKKIDYSWPNHLVKTQKNVLFGDSKPLMQKIKCKKALNLLSKFQFPYNMLPCIYNSIVDFKAIKSVKEKSRGKIFFSGVIPDVYSSIVLASEIDYSLYLYFPLSINGASDKSSGVIQGLNKRTINQKKQIKDVLNSDNYYHKDIGPFSSSIASIILGEYLIAKEKVKSFSGPEPSWYFYVMYLKREASLSLNSEKILDAANHTINKRKIFLPKSSNASKFTNVKEDGYFTGRMVLPKNIIDDVEKISFLLEDLIPQEENIIMLKPSVILKNWISFTLKQLIYIFRAIRS